MREWGRRAGPKSINLRNDGLCRASSSSHRLARTSATEVDFGCLSAHKHADSILARVLEAGRFEDVGWAVVNYGWERIHRFFGEVGHPEVSPRTVAMWRAILRAEDEEWASPPDRRRNSNVPWVD